MSEEKKINEEDFFDRLYHTEIKDRIVITPIISKDYIKNGLIDIRLGTEFLLTKKTRLSNLNPISLTASDIKSYQERITISIKDKIILHPNQFILGGTLEYIKLPIDIIGYIIGRSSWGRLGLIIATATIINPGFAGIITLELTNVGEVPINLYPGLRIAQISFHRCDFKKEEIEEKKSKYFGATRPSFSAIYEDTDNFLVNEEQEEIS